MVIQVVPALVINNILLLLIVKEVKGSLEVPVVLLVCVRLCAFVCVCLPVWVGGI